MFRKNTNQPSLVDSFFNQRETDLDKINKLVNWKPIEKLIESTYKKSTTGRPAYPVITMFKILLLQRWNNLSDPKMEEMLYDRLSFRRFAEIGVNDVVPDHSTIHRFRDRIANIENELFTEVTKQLSNKGLLVRECTAIDASLIPAAVRPPKSGCDSPDQNAKWGGKGKDKMIYGYKAHISVDQDSELVRKADLTSANVHDSRYFRQMVNGDEEIVLADKGYQSKKSSEYLERLDICDGIMRKASRKRPLDKFTLEFNRFISKRRSGVERIFGTIKRVYNLHRCRYRTLKRNRFDLKITLICYNLRRSLKLSCV